MTKFRNLQSELYVRKWVKQAVAYGGFICEKKTNIFLREAKREMYIAQCKTMKVHAASLRSSAKP